jgi:hypothetical protein
MIGCFSSLHAHRPKGNGMPKIKIETVLKKHTEALMSLPEVVGTGQGVCGGRDCIKVFVRQRTPELERRIPTVLDGYPVSIEETGEFRAIPE